MSNYLEEAFAPIEARYRQDVLQNTWGHLAPKRNKRYQGRIVYALGCLGSDELNPTVLHLGLADLDSSPWLYDHLQDFLGLQDGEAGHVYEFQGYFYNYTIKGSVRRILNPEKLGAPPGEWTPAWRPDAPPRAVHCEWQAYQGATIEHLSVNECYDRIMTGHRCYRHRLAKRKV